MAGTKVQTSKVCKCAILPDVAWFSGGLATGCKLQIIFRQKATDYRALLQKMTSKDKTSYGSSPPCTCMTFHRDTCMTCQKWRGVMILVWPCLACHRWMVDIRDTFNFMSLNASSVTGETWSYMYHDTSSFLTRLTCISMYLNSLSLCRDTGVEIYVSCDVVMHVCCDACMLWCMRVEIHVCRHLIFAIHSTQWVCIVYIQHIARNH